MFIYKNIKFINYITLGNFVIVSFYKYKYDVRENDLIICMLKQLAWDKYMIKDLINEIRINFFSFRGIIKNIVLIPVLFISILSFGLKLVYYFINQKIKFIPIKQIKGLK